MRELDRVGEQLLAAVREGQELPSVRDRLGFVSSDTAITIYMSRNLKGQAPIASEYYDSLRVRLAALSLDGWLDVHYVERVDRREPYYRCFSLLEIIARAAV